MAKDSRISPVPLGKATFLDSPRCDDLDTLDADVAIIGVPFGYPYDLAGLTSPSSSAPAALREESVRHVPFLTHYDYDSARPSSPAAKCASSIVAMWR